MEINMSTITVKNLTFAYPGSYDNIFEGTGFVIDTDWKLGFVGRNGRGKTTFLNLLLKKYEYSGQITAGCMFEYFPFDIPDKTIDTIDVIHTVTLEFMEWELMRELSLLKVPQEVLYRPFDTLSGGERTKVMLAALFLKEDCFLLIDEPTNHLDRHGREVVSEYLKGKSGFILVSHDRHFLDGCIDHILSINRASIEIEQGNFSSYHLNKERRDSFELAENEKLKKEIKRLKQTAGKKTQWANVAEDRKIGFDPNVVEKNTGRRVYEGAKSKKLMKRAKALQKRQEDAIEEKSTLLKDLESSENLRLVQQNFHTEQLVALSGITIKYGDKTVCEQVTFTLKRGERVSLGGKNGSGKTSIIKLICGEEVPHTGDVTVSERLKISYVSQDTSHLIGDLRDLATTQDIDESLFKAILRKLGFDRVQFDKRIENFSEGQKKKVLIAQSLCKKAHLLVWDEPLNYIDVISRMQIENLLIQHAPSILFVEHDKMFCEKVATKYIEL